MPTKARTRQIWAFLLTHEPVRRGLRLSDGTRYVLAVEPEIIGTLPEGST